MRIFAIYDGENYEPELFVNEEKADEYLEELREDFPYCLKKIFETLD